MKMNLYSADGRPTLCWIKVNNREVIALIQSLLNQMCDHNSNSGRLESKCQGACDELSICVVGEEIPA